eukprot:CAMPEP_0181053182 /NCGR_PEP_ID=MMETSP1070-20121207/17972_1 /TAXON_ID=265543 /ORGANISM="Minutocellus polymorphus, Strain NH13" /LENGTH=201 /DNA_ID=CAMNT_0023132295 /DNA_START=1 /DNA_END=604 /DNA_ORIENTATION=+
MSIPMAPPIPVPPAVALPTPMEDADLAAGICCPHSPPHSLPHSQQRRSSAWSPRWPRLVPSSAACPSSSHRLVLCILVLVLLLAVIVVVAVVVVMVVMAPPLLPPALLADVGGAPVGHVEADAPPHGKVLSHRTLDEWQLLQATGREGFAFVRLLLLVLLVAVVGLAFLAAAAAAGMRPSGYILSARFDFDFDFLKLVLEP